VQRTSSPTAAVHKRIPQKSARHPKQDDGPT